MRKNAVLMAIVVVAIVFALMFVAVPSPVVAQSVSVSLSITSIEKTDKGFVVKGTVTGSGLNSQGIPETDTVYVDAEINEGPWSKYPKLPVAMYYQRPRPEGAETPYTEGSGPGGTMTKAEYEGVGIDSVRIASFELRESPVWRVYGGIGEWEKNAPPTVTKEFEGTIPLEYAGKTLRIRATLRHQWGGPYCYWPAVSFHHDIGYEGKLEAVLDSDGDGVPDNIDKCPKTPPDTIVDDNGCPAKYDCDDNYVCDHDKGENCATCPNDCPCDTGMICNPSDSNADAHGCVGEGVAFTINVQAPGYLPWSDTLATKDYEPSSITLEGVVKDEDGNPVSGATISIPDLGKSVTSGVQGNYKLYVQTEGTKPFTKVHNIVLQKEVTGASIKVETEKVIPVPGEVTITITALDQDGKSFKGSVDITVVDKNNKQIYFTELKETAGYELDDNGKYSTKLEIWNPGERELKLSGGYTYLRDIPLTATIRVEIQDKELNTIGKAEKTVPFNLALIHGVVVDNKDLKPINQNFEPDVLGIPKSMVFDKEKNPNGDFWVMVKPIRRNGKSIQDIMNSGRDVTLNWDKSNPLPLIYSIERAPKAGEILELGKVGKTPLEKIKAWYNEFGRSPHTWPDGTRESKPLVGKYDNGNVNNFMGQSGHCPECLQYGCSALQYKTLSFLNNLKKKKAADENVKFQSKLKGWDYMPVYTIELPLYPQHNAVVLWDRAAPSWKEDGIILDPHAPQAPDWYSVKAVFGNTILLSWKPQPTAPHQESYGAIYPRVRGAKDEKYNLKYFDDNIRPPWPSALKQAMKQLIEGPLIVVECPVDILIVNSQGQRLGILPNGDTIAEFEPIDLYFWVDEKGDKQWFFALPQDTYEIELIGTGSGNFHLLTSPSGEEIYDYGDNPIAAGEQATLTMNPERDELILANGTVVMPTIIKLPPAPTPPPKSNKCEGDEPYLYVEDRIMEKGKTVEIPIIMCNAEELANMDLDWSYNASVLKLINVTKGSLNEKALFDWNEVSAGKLKIAFASSKGVTGSGSIAVMKFEVIGNTGDTSTLTGTVTTAGKTDGTEISVGVTPGEFTVGTAPVKGALKMSCENKDNEEKRCCCFLAAHTYRFGPQYVSSVVAKFDTGRMFDCRSSVQLQIDRGAGWETIKTVEAVSSSGDSGLNLIEVEVSVNDTILGFRIYDGCVCCIDFSEITVYGGGTQPPPTPAPAWCDYFDSATLDPRWSWVREDPTHWSLTDHPGYLRITTQRGDLWQPNNDGKNLLLTPAPAGDFEVTTHVTIKPTANYHNAALFVYQDDDNYLDVARQYASMWGGQQVFLCKEVEGRSDVPHGVPCDLTTVYLKITKQNSTYTGYWSIDGSNWTKVYQYKDIEFSNLKIGFTACNGGSTAPEITADFDYICVAPVGAVPTPTPTPTPTPNGYSDFGTTEILKKGFKGNVYYLEEGTSKLPDFSKMTPVGTIYTEKLDIPPRDFKQGFPGITDRFEWFGISYIGGIVIPSDGNYTFKLTSDDGAKLYIDGELVIDNDGIHPPRSKTKEVHLTKGDHLIGVDYFQGPKVTIALQLFVETSDGKETPVKPVLDPSELEEPTPTPSPTPQLKISDLRGTLNTDNDCNLYVADYGDNQVKMINPNGSVTTYASGIDRPRYQVFDSAGNLYVGSFDGNIYKVSASGGKTTVASGIWSPQGMGFDSAGNLYVAGGYDGKIHRIAPDGSKTTMDSGFAHPKHLAVYSDGNLYVVDSGGTLIVMITPEGGKASLVDLGETILGMATDGEYLYVSNADKISRIDTSGQVTQIATDLDQPSSLTVCNGSVFVTVRDGIVKLKISDETKTGTCDWTGAWETDWDRMELQQNGNKVNGTYTHDQGRIQGTVSGRKLIGTWSEYPSYSPPGDAGDIVFIISEDCSSFDGKWRYGTSGGWSGSWTGARTSTGSGTSYREATLSHSGFDFSEGTTGESLINDGEIIFWQPGGGTHPSYPRDSGYLWWRNIHLDDVNYASQTKDMGAVDIATVREVPAEWDKSPLIPPLLVGHTIVAKCYDGYVKFQVISVDTADESARVKYSYSPDTTFDEGTPTLQPTP